MKAKFLIPFGIFIVLAGFLFKGLYLDPRTLPSVLINKELPPFELPTLWDPNTTFKTEDMKGKVVDVIQTGYTFNGKILRYAKVVVGA